MKPNSNPQNNYSEAPLEKSSALVILGPTKSIPPLATTSHSLSGPPFPYIVRPLRLLSVYGLVIHHLYIHTRKLNFETRLKSFNSSGYTFCKFQKMCISSLFCSENVLRFLVKPRRNICSIRGFVIRIFWLENCSCLGSGCDL